MYNFGIVVDGLKYRTLVSNLVNKEHYFLVANPLVDKVVDIETVSVDIHLVVDNLAGFPYIEPLQFRMDKNRFDDRLYITHKMLFVIALMEHLEVP